VATDYKYTAADFERYHSGRMTEGEMHELEKAALEDPFLADALEGYIYTTSPVKDIDEIKEKLFAKKKKRNIFLLLQKQNVWLRIAALFILIAGIGYLAYQLNFNKENTTLAKKEDRQEIKNETKQNTVPKIDSINDQKETDVSPLTTTETVKNKENKKIEDKTKLSADKAIEKPTEDLQKQSVETVPSPEEKRDLFKLQERSFMKGVVVDSLGNPIQYAIIKDKNAQTIISTDSAGRFKMKANDSSLTADISAPGYKTEQKILSDKKEQVIVMEHDNNKLEEVVVTANGVKRNSKDLGYSTSEKKASKVNINNSLQGRVSGLVINKSTQQSADLQKFADYVKNNIAIPKDEEGKNYKGNVVLSFQINKKGKPKNIRVEQSLSATCDKEASRLLLHGPKWEKTNAKRNSVTIRF